MFDMTVPNAGPQRILVVEDDALIGSLLTEVLQALGYAVCPVETTEDGAVSAAARHRPDLMIVDLQLAAGSGLSAMARISQTGPIPHVFMSGDSHQPATLGMVLLRKPFRQSDLIRAIDQALCGETPGRAA